MNDRRFYEAPVEGARRSAPAALRNIGPIGDVLKEWLPKTGLILEIASGTGEHALAFAERFPALGWQPSDRDADALHSIEAWATGGPSNLLAPLALDASSPDWAIEHADAIVAINMVHISPWQSSLGLIEGSARVLPAEGPLVLYGPWIEPDVPTTPSNQLFDLDLRSRDPSWGLRNLADFTRAAEAHGLILEQRRSMPANNIMVQFSRR